MTIIAVRRPLAVSDQGGVKKISCYRLFAQSGLIPILFLSRLRKSSQPQMYGDLQTGLPAWGVRAQNWNRCGEWCGEGFCGKVKGVRFLHLTPCFLVARQGGLEPPTDCLEGNCSIRLSYWRAKWKHSLFFPGLKVKSVPGHFLLLPALEASMNLLRIASPGVLVLCSNRIPGWAFFNLFPLR